jgi:hypothetical protein
LQVFDVSAKFITITIEDADGSQVIRVPIAQSVKWEIEYKDQTSYDILEHQPSEIESMSLTFEPCPDKKGISHYIHHASR